MTNGSVKNPKYLHISPDDKFFDYVISNIENTIPGESIYLASKGNDKNLEYVKSQKAIIVKSLEDVKSLHDSYKRIETVYIHFLTQLAIDFILSLPKDKKVVWVFWGSDGYKLPLLKRYEYLPVTKSIVERLDKSFNLKWFSKKFNSLFDYKLLRRIKAVKRINYCATWVEGDYQLVKQYNPKLKFIFFNNNSINQLIDTDVEAKNSVQKGQYIYIGNSCDPRNNHFEAFTLIAHQLAYNIVVPLSYGGSKSYKKYILEEGKRVFNGRFKPILEFVPKQDYHHLIINASFIIMNHSKQQAANNILVALWYGKIVFMNSTSTLYSTFRSWGLDIFTIEDLSFPVNEERYTVDRSKNRSILLNKLGEKAIQESYRKFLFLEQ